MEEYDDWIKAGKLAAEARDYGAGLVKKGTKLSELARLVDEKIVALGGQSAFPVNISLNATAAHDTAIPADERIFADDIVKIDVGVHVNGAIGDTAKTVDLTGKYTDIVKASEEALRAALEIARPGTEIGKIGAAIQETIQSYGLAAIRNLSGHGLARFEVHDSPAIPNNDTGNNSTLKEGMIIAIEPFATNGTGLIQESGNASIYSQISENPVRDRTARQVLLEVKKYNKLPFASRWLTKFSAPQARFGLVQLVRAGVIRDYPPLVEIAKGMVSQAEHTIIVLDEPIITTKL